MYIKKKKKKNFFTHEIPDQADWYLALHGQASSAQNVFSQTNTKRRIYRTRKCHILNASSEISLCVKFQPVCILYAKFKLVSILCAKFQPVSILVSILCAKFQPVGILCAKFQPVSILCAKFQPVSILCVKFQLVSILCTKFQPVSIPYIQLPSNLPE